MSFFRPLRLLPQAATARSAHVLLAVAIAGATPALAAEAHVHGQAVLEVSLAGPGLSVVLRGPAQVFFGFEHPPTSEEEARVVQAALAALRAPEASVLQLSPACELESVAVDTPFSAWLPRDAIAAEDSYEEACKGHEHGEHHEHEEHPAGAHHDDAEEAGAPEHVGHTDLEVAYGFACAEGGPRSLTLTAFSAFPALERVEAAWISDSAAGSAALTREVTRLSLQAP